MSAVVVKSTVGLSREEWLADRRLGIGGSDAAVVCGVSRWKSPLQLWMEKTGQLPPEDAGEVAYWGTQLEPLIREEFIRRSGIKVIVVNKLLRSHKYPFMLANLDGVCRCPIHGKCVFESKSASAYKDDEWENDAVPYDYVLQGQHYLAVTDYNGVYYAVLIGGNTFKWTYMPRDEAIISMLVRTERGFWAHVQDGVPPQPDGSKACVELMAKLYPSSVPMSKIELPATAVDLIHQYKEADEQLDRLTALKQEAGNRLKDMLGNNEIGTIGENSISWKTCKQNRFDSKAFAVEQPDLYARYVRESSHRRFIVKKAS